jgi:hypothetical protein
MVNNRVEGYIGAEGVKKLCYDALPLKEGFERRIIRELEHRPTAESSEEEDEDTGLSVAGTEVLLTAFACEELRDGVVGGKGLGMGVLVFCG